MRPSPLLRILEERPTITGAKLRPGQFHISLAAEVAGIENFAPAPRQLVEAGNTEIDS